MKQRIRSGPREASPSSSSPSFASRRWAPARAVEAPRTDMPAPLREGLEELSGLSLPEVRVHYDSPLPATLQARAFTEGRQIHLGPGQERHLAHEAWHVVQQEQGRVRPTLRLGGAEVNDDPALEREAEAMGARAAAGRSFLAPVFPAGERSLPPPAAGGAAVVQRFKDPLTQQTVTLPQIPLLPRDQVERYLELLRQNQLPDITFPESTALIRRNLDFALPASTGGPAGALASPPASSLSAPAPAPQGPQAPSLDGVDIGALDGAQVAAYMRLLDQGMLRVSISQSTALIRRNLDLIAMPGASPARAGAPAGPPPLPAAPSQASSPAASPQAPVPAPAAGSSGPSGSLPASPSALASAPQPAAPPRLVLTTDVQRLAARLFRPEAQENGDVQDLLLRVLGDGFLAWASGYRGMSSDELQAKAAEICRGKLAELQGRYPHLEMIDLVVIHAYSWYADKYVREARRDRPGQADFGVWQQFADQLVVSLRKLRRFVGQELYRCSRPGNAGEGARMRAGTGFHAYSFLSTTYTKEARQALEKDDKYAAGYTLILDARNVEGYHIEEFSRFSGEHEVVLLPGHTLNPGAPSSSASGAQLASTPSPGAPSLSAQDPSEKKPGGPKPRVEIPVTVEPPAPPAAFVPLRGDEPASEEHFKKLREEQRKSKPARPPMPAPSFRASAAASGSSVLSRYALPSFLQPTAPAAAAASGPSPSSSAPPMAMPAPVPASAGSAVLPGPNVPAFQPLLVPDVATEIVGDVVHVTAARLPPHATVRISFWDPAVQEDWVEPTTLMADESGTVRKTQSLAGRPATLQVWVTHLRQGGLSPIVRRDI